MPLKTRILGFDITLNCSRCGKECYLVCDPSFDDLSPNFNLLVLINDTHRQHQVEGCPANAKLPKEELKDIKVETP